MEGINCRGKWKRKVAVAALLLLCNLSLASSQSHECPHGDYLTDDGICCNKCPPGFKLKEVCHAEGHRSICERCRDGLYTDQMNYAPNCRSCKRCKKNEEVESKCERNRDTVCRCKDGFYKDLIDSETHQCLRCSKCTTGESQKCTPERNTVCECEKDYYKIKDKCLPCKNCTADCELHCPPVVVEPVTCECFCLASRRRKGQTWKNSLAPENGKWVSNVVMIGIGVLVVSVLLLVSITYKATKQCSDTSPDPSPDACDASPDSTKILMLTEDPDDDKCNSAVPQHPVSDQEPTNLPDCIPLEIKIPDLIYTVLDLVPVQQMKQLARSLGLTDIEIERAETDHRACQEAHYQMLRVWAERGSRVAGGGGGGGRGGVLHRPLMQELMDNLMKMHLGGAAEELEAKYGIQ